jgi:ketosteroid isomerase-like protein
MADTMQSHADHSELLDDYWRGSLRHDFVLLRRVAAPDFVYWLNTDRAGRRPLSLDEAIELVFGVSQKKGYDISLSDVRRFTIGDTIIQQDIATVVAPDGASRFARCFVIQVHDGKVRSVLEYYDSTSAAVTTGAPPELKVPAQ